MAPPKTTKFEDEMREAWGYRFKWTKDHQTPEQYDYLKHSCDTLGEDCAVLLNEMYPAESGTSKSQQDNHSSNATSRDGAKPENRPSKYRDLYELFCEHHTEHPKLQKLWEEVNTTPDWVDWDQIARGQDVLYRYGGAAFTGLTYQSLVGGTAGARVAEVLGRTGGFNVNTVFRRMLETTIYFIDVTESVDSLKFGGRGFASCMRVRFLHGTVRHRILQLAAKRPSYFSVEKLGIPINDLDSIGTIAVNCATIIWQSLPRQGIHMREQEIRDYVALWRLIAYYMGTPTDFFSTPAKARAIMESLYLYEYNPSSRSQTHAQNIIIAMSDTAPSYASKPYLEATARWLNGDPLADALGIGQPSRYYTMLAAGQCVLFMIVYYTCRDIHFLDRAQIASFRRNVRDYINNPELGLDHRSAFNFKYLPSSDDTKQKGEGETLAKSNKIVFWTADRKALAVLLILRGNYLFGPFLAEAINTTIRRQNLAHGADKHQTMTRSDVVIIGAGFSGICMAIKLLEAGIRDIVIVEKSAGFGGTWKDNIYPGSCCDSCLVTPVLVFLCTEPSLVQSVSRTERDPYVAQKYGLYKLVRFGSEVTAAEWDSESHEWSVAIQVLAAKEAEFCPRYTIKASFLIAGVGQLNEPFWPKITGQESFQGRVMHSARWDWSYDFAGKRVGIIGNGATAVQIAPEVAKAASNLTIFQRSPNWLMPRFDAEIPRWKRVLFDHVPAVLSRVRGEIMNAREAYYEAVNHADSSDSSTMTEICKQHMQTQLPSRPDLWEKLTPNYPPGCKRILLSDDYYPTLRLSHVTLETRQIDRMTATGVVVKEGLEEKMIDLDLVIFATGFQAKDFMHGIHVQGVGGQTLSSKWANGASALYGVTVDTLPNFGMLYGPNTNLGHNSIILMIEAQARYLVPLVTRVVKSRARGGKLSLMPRALRVQEWNKDLQNSLGSSTFADPRCSSWYKTDSGVVTNNWSGTVVEYQKLLSKVDWSDYELGGDGGENLPTGKEYIGRVMEETIFSTQQFVSVTVLAALTGAVSVYLHRRGHLLKHIL
ncbi:flavin-binding monooxygenase-like family [Fusarium subglutinans]|uniref:Flavin-binding monooxygenase-like family n=1 Tax=Gibberella subglutinans TaxID=42677 RepID=A0A8H5LDB8_GIBSU|nr:flavin-binding monooxygenase-like family [Fusarium subglutinans]KAF5589842.1 flavin-binding monooxygenase-like family [Fusarium subglutinans]